MKTSLVILSGVKQSRRIPWKCPSVEAMGLRGFAWNDMLRRRFNTSTLQPFNVSTSMWEVMFWPIVACVLLTWLLVYLGLHVIQRGIIFIDIAMAQMAALGICVAILFRLDLESWTTFFIGLGFTLIGAAIFSVTGKRASQIPQEAVIGIAYVVAAAAAVLLLSRAAEGDEEIKNILVGNILLVTPREVWERFVLFAAVGIFHFIFRRNFLLVSFDRDGA